MQIKTHNSNFKVQTKTTISTEQNISKYWFRKITKPIFHFLTHALIQIIPTIHPKIYELDFHQGATITSLCSHIPKENTA